MTSAVEQPVAPKTACFREDETPYEFRLSTYDFRLPSELIAQHPISRRDASRLMVIHRGSGCAEHRRFYELTDVLDPSDLLVLNETRVVPALLVGNKESGGRVELLVLDPMERLAAKDSAASRVCLVRSSKRVRSGMEVHIPGSAPLVVEQPLAPGSARVRFPVAEPELIRFLYAYGRTPLPPYIRRDCGPEQEDSERYQTVYAATSGSVAAPTAGLHLTDDLLQQMQARGTEVARIVLHVGPGTFMPVRHEDVRSHRMHAEYYDIPQRAAQQIGDAIGVGRRIVAVGTTSLRALESAARGGTLREGEGTTDLFITPGHRFAVVGALITNFHLPGSTLLMLVCAFGGTNVILNCYQKAINECYRFYSYGDACLIID